MKGFRFYIDREDREKRFTRSEAAQKAAAGALVNCLALVLDDNGKPYHNGRGCLEAVVSISSRPNAPVCESGVAQAYLRAKCTRIPAALVPRLHPALWARCEDMTGE